MYLIQTDENVFIDGESIDCIEKDIDGNIRYSLKGQNRPIMVDEKYIVNFISEVNLLNKSTALIGGMCG